MTKTKKETVPKKEVKKKSFIYKVAVDVNGEVTELKGNDLGKMLSGLSYPRVNSRFSIEVSSKNAVARKDLKAFEAKLTFTGVPNTRLDLLVINIERMLA